MTGAAASQAPRVGGRRLLRKVPFFAVAIVIALAIPAVIFVSMGASQRRGPAALESPTIVLRRGNGAEPESLDPHRARSEAALTILRDLYEGLTEIGPDGTPVLAAADQCAISADGLTYRFHLRPLSR